MEQCFCLFSFDSRLLSKAFFNEFVATGYLYKFFKEKVHNLL